MGFNQIVESRWHYAERAGRVVITSTVHAKQPQQNVWPFELRVNHQIIEPMGLQRAFLLANSRGGPSGVCTIGIMHILGSGLKPHSHPAGRIVDGTPAVAYQQVAVNGRRVSRLRLAEHDITTTARQRGLMPLAQVRYAVAERDGTISIVQEEAA